MICNFSPYPDSLLFKKGNKGVARKPSVGRLGMWNVGKINISSVAREMVVEKVSGGHSYVMALTPWIARNGKVFYSEILVSVKMWTTNIERETDGKK